MKMSEYFPGGVMDGKIKNKHSGKTVNLGDSKIWHGINSAILEYRWIQSGLPNSPKPYTSEVVLAFEQLGFVEFDAAVFDIILNKYGLALKDLSQTKKLPRITKEYLMAEPNKFRPCQAGLDR